MERQQLINVILPLIIQDGADRATADKIIEMKSTSELSILYARFVREGRIKTPVPVVTQADADQAAREAELELEAIRERNREALSRSRAERMADAILFQRQQHLDQEPQRAAQLQKDKQTFVEAYNRIRNFGNNEANWNIVSSTLGPGFTVYDLEQALSSNAIQLSAPNQAEIDEWAKQDVEAHNRRILDMPIHELKAAIRKEAADRRQQVEQAEAERVQKLQEQMDSYLGYPPMPLVNSDGVKLDSLFFRRASAATIRLYIRRYGNAQITNAIRNRNQR